MATTTVGSLLVSLGMESSAFDRGIGQAQRNMANAAKSIQASGRQINTTTGSMKSGMQQLSFQLNDIATQWASGTRPMQIFAQQAGHVGQAIGLMSTGAGRFGAFMSGPWGVAITAGIVVLSALIPKLLETEKAMEDVKFASNAMGDAQGILGNVMDLTTGKINTQNKALIALARAQLAVAKIQSKMRETEARGQIKSLSGPQRSVQGGPGGGFSFRTQNSVVGQVESQLRNGIIDYDQAIKQLERFNQTKRISDKEFADAASAFANLGVEIANQKVFSEAEALLNGTGGTSLLKPGKASKASKAKEDKTAQNDAAYQAELRQMQVERLRNEAEYTANLKVRYDADLAAIDAEMATYEQNVMLDKDRTAAQKEKLIATRRELAEQQKQLAEQEYSRAVATQAAELEKSSLQIQIQDLQVRAELADNSKDRRDAELAILALQDRLRIAELDRILAVEATASAAWQNARAEKDALIASQASRANVVKQGAMGPGEAYARDINKSAGALNDAIDGIKVDGLRSLEDGLVNAIVQFKSLADVAKNVVSQVLSELLRLQIQQAIIKPLAGALGIPGFAGGTNFAPGGLALVGERGPELVNLPRGSQVMPNHELAGMAGGQQVHKPTFVFPGVTDSKTAREAAGQAARRYRSELNGPTRGY